MGLFDNFPYTNFHELNLDWILRALKEIEKLMDQFVALNSLKYADPIQWDITSQYEKNTIVIEPVTGTAYISVQPVPSGVAISNTDYWSVVFDLSQFITQASQNFANTYEANYTTTATMPTTENGWIIWNSALYQALTDITPGDAYIEDGNIKRMTVENFFNILNGDIKAEAQTRRAEDIRIELALSDLITSKVDIEARARADADTRIELELRDLIASEVIARTDEDININNRIDQILEDLPNYDNFITPEEYGAIGDGITDDTIAINNALAACSNSGKIFLFTKKYLVDGHYTGNFHTTGLQIPSNIVIRFASGSEIIETTNNTETSSIFTMLGVENVDIEGGILNGDYDTHIHESATTDEWCHGITIYGCKNVSIRCMTVRKCYGDGIYVGQYPYYGGDRPDDNHNKDITLENIRVDYAGRNGISFTECDGWHIDNIYITNVNRTNPKSAIDFELEGDYNPYLSSGIVTNVATKNCLYSIKVVGQTNEMRIANVSGDRIYIESNSAQIHIDDCICAINHSETNLHVNNCRIPSMNAFGAGTLYLNNCRVVWGSNVQCKLKAVDTIIANPIVCTQSARFVNCHFVLDAAANYMVSLRGGENNAIYEFLNCIFDYGSHGRAHNAISDSSDINGKLTVLNCITVGSSANINSTFITSSKANILADGNNYHHYSSIGGLALVTGCVNFDY